MMSFGHDVVIKMSTPRKLVCPPTRMFLKDSMSSFVKLWCDDSSDSASFPLTYTNFNPEVVVHSPRLPARKILFVTKLFCGRTTHHVLFSNVDDRQVQKSNNILQRCIKFDTSVSRNTRLIISHYWFENDNQTTLQRNGWISMTRAQAWNMVSTSHTNTYISSHMQCKVQEPHIHQ
jgi:hypothetical protein